ncbi:MAG TPA: multiprotein-bridging factor 1 family protein [archaeon]|nr:multiprotein-bridging factor 1 family protein [archaeon]
MAIEIMQDCEICGSKNAAYTSKIEGASMHVCKNCAGSGNIISRPAPPPAIKKLPRPPEGLGTELMENLSSVVKTEREKRKLTRQELARKISIQENLIARIENGWSPPLDLIRKLEKFLSVKLTEN